MSTNPGEQRTGERHSSAAAFEVRHQLVPNHREVSPSMSVETGALSSESFGELVQVITLDGHCDGLTVADAHGRIRDALDAGRSQIVFDLRGAVSVIPSMLYMLSRGAIEAKAQKGSLAIVKPNHSVWIVFEDAGLDPIFPTFATLQEAVAAASRP